MKKEHYQKGPVTHGQSYTVEYTAWIGMKARCHNPKHPKYPAYGGRGLIVCDKWRNSFESFFADMGARPGDTFSVERTDGNKGYSPDNCIWADKTVQAENRPVFNNLIEFQGKKQSLSAWAREIGITRESLRSRFDSKWTIEQALTTLKGGLK